MKQTGKVKALLALLLTYMKIGLFTFGGGYAMIAMIEEEVVKKKQWITKEALTDIVTVAESTPGPIAINCATFVGYQIAGTLGALTATVAVVIPSFVIIYLISLFFSDMLRYPLINAAFRGIQCAVGLIILRTGYGMRKSFEKTPLSVSSFVLAFLAVLAIKLFALPISTLYLILVGGIIGVITYLIGFLRARKEGKMHAD